jgi:predicted ATPase
VLERIYVDNVRSFVNFEWRPGRLALLMGPNGAGKTSLFRLLADLQGFIAGALSTEEVFPESSRTRWDSRFEQTIELDARIKGNLHRYRLVVMHDQSDPGRSQIAEESLRVGGTSVVEFASGQLRLARQDGAESPAIQANPGRSAVGALVAGRDDLLLDDFKGWIWKLWALRPDPRAMTARLKARVRSVWLHNDLSNFGEWYVRELTAKPGSVFKAVRALEDVLPGFRELYESAGELRARFEIRGRTEDYGFDELSDGQRALIALYVVLHTQGGPGKILAIDEPDNYVALREIQPWLTELMDRALRSDGPQAWLISHHPEVLNLLAIDYGWRFFRDGDGPTRVERFPAPEGVEPAEAVARGWDDERER